jgi:hypothetical protein
MIQFGQAGHAGDYKPLPLEAMAKMYKEQRQTVTA